MATECEQAAMDHFGAQADASPEWQALRKKVAEQRAAQDRRMREMLDGAVKASRLMEDLRNSDTER